MDPKEILELANAAHAAAQSIVDEADAAHVAKGGTGQATLSAEQQERVDKHLADYAKHKASHDAATKAARQREQLASHDEWLNESQGRRSPGDSGTMRTAADQNKPITLTYRGQDIHIADGSPLHERASSQYISAFQDYLGTGRVRADLHTGSKPDGGYAVPTQMSYELLRAVDDYVFMRQLCRVLPPLTAAASLGILSLDAKPLSFEWTAEVPATIPKDNNIKFGKRELEPHLLTKEIDLSMKLIRLAALPIEQMVREEMQIVVGQTMENAYLNGTGNKQPLGVFVTSDDGIPAARNVAASAQTAFKGDDLWNVVFSLKPQYRQNATWLGSTEWVKRCMLLKNGQGDYIFQRSMSADIPATICNRPFVESAFAPATFTNGLPVAVLGDFNAGYYIVDSLQLEFQRLGELLARQNQIGIIARIESDGMPVRTEAFARMVMA